MVRREEPGFDWGRLDLHEYVEALIEERPGDQFTVVAHQQDVAVVKAVLARQGWMADVVAGERPPGQPMLLGKGRD